MRKWLWRSAKLCAVAAYVAVAAEALLRVFAPVAILPRYMTATGYGIRGNEPNRTYWQVSSEYRVQVRTNSKGIRADVDFPYTKPAGVKRIVALGDSFGMGYEVDLKDTFLSQMESKLEKAGVDVQVVNLSVSGYGNSEELISLQAEGLKYEPDLVLLCWHSSDYLDNVRSALHQVEHGRVVAKNRTYLPGVRVQQRLFQIPAYAWLAEHSHLYGLLREFLAIRVVKPLLVTVQNARNASVPNEEAYSTNPAVDPTQAELSVKILKEIERVSASCAARFAVLDIPVRVSRTDFTSVFPRDDCGETYGFPVICPIETFKRNSGQLLYWERSHDHFTPLGSQLVGQLLAEEILNKGMLDAADRN